ncbi:PREDICTED: uncharacterized protein LOC109127279 [Camelina sativa]|uniref:Uncharacterized protein LOC109127279 n=1 Tax=Camelina sativa TaxID=90675 RepID=A0ABM1QKW8_CAMSA|nr:PREDICTED: uncharacterized protein LOC109127279 [Camelina sativa]
MAYAMPVYSMNYFELLAELCSELDRLIANFWSGSTRDKRKLSWVAWKKLITSKDTGGLGFRDFKLSNQALLANHVWKIMKRPNSLVYRLLKARYFKDGIFFSATKGHKPSYGWNSLRFGRDLLATGVQFNIGDGNNTKMGVDPWLPTNPPRLLRLINENDKEKSVKLLIHESSPQWDDMEIPRLIDPRDHYLIHKIYLPSTPTADDYLWSCSKDGQYTVKSGYWQALSLARGDNTPKALLATNPDIAKRIWKLDITPKLKHILCVLLPEQLEWQTT